MKRRSWLQWIVLLVHLVFALGCASTPRKSVRPEPDLFAELQARYPHAKITPVCARPSNVPWSADVWVYLSGGSVVAYADEIFPLAAKGTHIIHVFDPIAPQSNVVFLPIPDNRINCEAWLEEKIDTACSIASFEQRPNPRYIAQPVIRSPSVPPRGAVFAPNCDELTRARDMRQIMTEWFDAGKNLGVIIGGADAGMKHLMAAGGGAVAKEFEKDPKFLDALLAGLAKRIDAVSMPAAQTDPELVGIARSSFQDGYGEGVAQIQLKFDMMYVASTAAIVLSGQIAGAVEMAGAKALQVATTRWRSLPIFVPGAAGGVAGVVRLPKASVPAAKPAPAPAPAKPAPALAKPAPAPAKPAPAPPLPTAQTTRSVTRNKTTGQIVTPASTRTTTRTKTTGQMHHGISSKIHDALQKHATLKNVYKHRDSRLVTQALDKSAHNGYETWHRNMETKVIKWLDKNDLATPAQFEAYLRHLYKTDGDLNWRFPNGF